MQNLRVIRRRIRSVENTQKITRAMEMVAGAKLKRLQTELVSFIPYHERLKGILRRFLEAHPRLEHPLLEPTPLPVPPPHWGKEIGRGNIPPVGLILVTSDAGLCGTYNDRVIAQAEAFLKEYPSTFRPSSGQVSLGADPKVRVVAIGKRGSRFLSRHGIAQEREILHWSGRYFPEEAGRLLDWIKDTYLTGKVSSWWVATTQFVSALRYRPVTERLLPVERPAAPNLPEKVITEPDIASVADELLKRFVEAQFARILLEAFTSEHSARMIAMKNATDNAAEMIEELTLIRNKARQAAITKELIEVVSGAEALK